MESDTFYRDFVENYSGGCIGFNGENMVNQITRQSPH